MGSPSTMGALPPHAQCSLPCAPSSAANGEQVPSVTGLLAAGLPSSPGSSAGKRAGERLRSESLVTHPLWRSLQLVAVFTEVWDAGLHHQLDASNTGLQCEGDAQPANSAEGGNSLYPKTTGQLKNMAKAVFKEITGRDAAALRQAMPQDMAPLLVLS